MLIERLYAEGLRPDWWLVETETETAGWHDLADAVRRHDPFCRGLIAIARSEESARRLAEAAGQPLLRGFVAGRAVFGDAFRDWLAGTLDDRGAVAAMVERFDRLCRAWDGGAERAARQVQPRRSA